MRRQMDAGLAGALAAVALVVGLAAGFIIGVDVEARQDVFLGPPPEVVEDAGDPGVPYKCTLGEWHVQPGDTMWGIASLCYEGEHTGQMVAEIRAANPGIDPGRMRLGDVLMLPERGR